MQSKNQIVCFNVNDKYFGIEAEFVSDIKGVEEVEIFRMPKAPANVEGIICIRGEIFPVISISITLGKGDSTDTKIIVINHNEIKIGILVEKIEDILEYTGKIKEAEGLGYIKGSVSINSKNIEILNIDQII